MTAEGESEQCVFYRGVGNRRSPLRMTTTKDGESYDIYGNFREVPCTDDTSIRAMWLVDVRADGAAAFRAIDSVNVRSDASRLRP